MHSADIIAVIPCLLSSVAVSGAAIRLTPLLFILHLSHLVMLSTAPFSIFSTKNILTDLLVYPLPDSQLALIQQSYQVANNSSSINNS